MTHIYIYIYINILITLKVELRLKFRKINTEYYLELLTPEMMKLLGALKIK